MPNVHGIQFNSNQSELVKSLIRELIKDRNCDVYALPHMKPNGELRMACTPPKPSPRHQRGVFLRILPGDDAAVVVRPLNAKSGPERTVITKYIQDDLLAMIRSWRQEIEDLTPAPPLPRMPIAA